MKINPYQINRKLTAFFCALLHHGQREIRVIRLPGAVIAEVRCIACHRTISTAVEPYEQGGR